MHSILLATLTIFSWTQIVTCRPQVPTLAGVNPGSVSANDESDTYTSWNGNLECTLGGSTWPESPEYPCNLPVFTKNISLALTNLTTENASLEDTANFISIIESDISDKGDEFPWAILGSYSIDSQSVRIEIKTNSTGPAQPVTPAAGAPLANATIRSAPPAGSNLQNEDLYYSLVAIRNKIRDWGLRTKLDFEIWGEDPGADDSRWRAGITIRTGVLG